MSTTTTYSGVAEDHESAGWRGLCQSGVNATSNKFFVRSWRQPGPDAERRVGRGEYNVYDCPGQARHTNSESMGAIHVRSSADRRRGERDQSLDASSGFLCDRYYVSMTSGYSWVDIRRFCVPYGLPCEHVRLTCSGLGLRLDEWAHLLKLVPTIHDRHPELTTTEPSGEETDKRL